MEQNAFIYCNFICVLESPGLPTGFEKLSIMRIHFEQYCQVSGIVFLPGKAGVRRALVAFPSVKIAEALHDTKQRIRGALVDIKALSSESLH